MRRDALGWCLCCAALLGGVLTAALSAANRARGDELDRLERWCEAQVRKNELLLVEIERREWILLGEHCNGAHEPRPGGAP